MQEAQRPQSTSHVEPWWYQEEEPDFLVLPEPATDADAVATAGLPSIAARLDALERLASATGPELDGLRGDVAELREGLRVATDRIGDVLRSTGKLVQTAVEEAASTMGEEHTATMDRYAGEFAEAVQPLREGLERVERLGSMIEAMATKRGFRELVQSEEVLREEQAALIRRLAEADAAAAARVAGIRERMDQLDERLEASMRGAEALQRLPGQAAELVATEAARVRTELTESLRARFEEQVQAAIVRLRAELDAGLPVQDALARLGEVIGTQTDLVRVQRDVDGVVASLRTEVRGLQDRIGSWGAPRTAPRLAREVHELAGRVEGLEAELSDGFAERVAEAVERRVLDGLSKRRRRRA